MRRSFARRKTKEFSENSGSVRSNYLQLFRKYEYPTTSLFQAEYFKRAKLIEERAARSPKFAAKLKKMEEE